MDKIAPPITEIIHPGMMMKLQEALLLMQSAKKSANTPHNTFLAIGTTPLHLQIFMAAYYYEFHESGVLNIIKGQYGDLIGAVNEAKNTNVNSIAVIIEYSDLDPRFGFRRTGGWTREVIQDAVASATQRLKTLELALRSVDKRCVIMLPTLPLPPLESVGTWQMSSTELRLKMELYAFAERLTQNANIVFCNTHSALQGHSLNSVRDLQSEFVADTPYSTTYTADLARILVQNLKPRPSLKGIITDLDDTLWAGLVGEVGERGVTWSLDDKSQIHAVYQQMLNAFAERGVLIGIASKNTPEVVSKALERKDLVVNSANIFPIEVSWGAKSEAVARILKAWNIFEDSVIFIDDNPLELAEVKSRFPAIKTMQFKPKDFGVMLENFYDLVGFFHKEFLSAEDGLRIQSLKNAQHFNNETNTGESAEAFLSSINAEITTDFKTARTDPRAFELLNKTNQFNLNGLRLEEEAWKILASSENSFIGVTQYTDKFGPLGKIAVILGKKSNNEANVTNWVLSCRAFSRRVEYAILDDLFQIVAVEKIHFDFLKTDKNGPIQTLMEALCETDTAGKYYLTRERFYSQTPKLYRKGLPQ